MISWLNEKTKKYPYKMAIFGTLIPFWIWYGFFAPLEKMPEGHFQDARSWVIIFYFLVVFIAPIIEELLFRKFLWWILSDVVFRSVNWGSVVALFTTSILFACIHGDPHRIMMLMPLSFFLGYLRLKTGSVKPCIVAHMLNNISVFVAVLPWMP